MTSRVFFQFEADFVQSLRCIPMQVRYKLDTCGVKLKLQHWNQFNDRDRHNLVESPCDTITTIQDYRDRLRQLVQTQTGEYPKDLPIEDEPPWSRTDVIPEDVLTEVKGFDQSLSIDQWRSLSDLQRFALIKLSRPGHENRNFQPALVEFGLAESRSHFA